MILFLDAEFCHALAKLQADKCLGRSYAGLMAFTEGLFSLGYLSKESYEAHVERYSEPLYSEASKPKPKEQPRCDFCGKQPVVASMKDKVLGLVKNCCAYHAEKLSNHEKWVLVANE